MTTLLLCLSCLCAGYVAGRLRRREPVRRIPINRMLAPRWDWEQEKVERN